MRPLACRSLSRLPRPPTLVTPLSTLPRPRPLPPPSPLPPPHRRPSSSSPSSSRWKTRQSTDPYAASARLSSLKSRAAYKLLELDQRHRLFRPGQTVIDLGFAPGAWSQVAVSRTRPGGRVVGVDVIPAMPPRGASSIQGNFLSEEVRGEVRRFVGSWGRGRAGAGRGGGLLGGEDGRGEVGGGKGGVEGKAEGEGEGEEKGEGDGDGVGEADGKRKDKGTVDVVLSDMSAPWPLASGSWIKSVSNPYHRMMNTSGVSFRDHAGSMDLCLAALTFCFDTLKTGGHFVCKFYQGAEEKAFEMRLKKLFEKVVREKPDASRKESKEAYFVALRRKPDVSRTLIFPEDTATEEI
ncbi:FtsJ-like methyltransferase-domain-containing protein [Elsinoe ampelina]|uniref:rRNA methyltransferase 2, mitochondrial n=1 Tax=Elsinoe ampelina TaxID=302913 RepID=A0A6A6GQC5_9PEZI|nr:FtsJ-like methyltransferase-domain-containing protein [Elsinoe ampelina]